MFSHQQGQHGRVNGAAGRGQMQMMYNFQQHQNPNQQHTQHHTNMQQDQSSHATNGSVLGHHATYSSGVLSNSTPTFTPAALQNGHNGVTRGGQAQAINEHWSLQLELHKESDTAHQRMTVEGAPNHFARLKAGENRGLAQAAQVSDTAESQEDGENTLGRMADNNPSKRQDWHNLDLSGQGLRVLTAPVFKYTFLKELYVASNKLTQIPPSISQLRFLTHLDASNNQLTELPAELGICVYLKQLLVFDNSITDLPYQLGSLYNLEVIGIEGNPLNAKAKNMIMNEGTKALITELRETAPIPDPPPPREIISLQGDEKSSTNPDKFKVFSYNILSDPACTTRLYGHSPTAALAWEHRKATVLEDIRLQNADFVCLQEVDDHTFKEYFCVELAHNGYKGIFWARTRSRTMGFLESKNVDGCATFYKHKKYICLDKTLVDFANLAINRPDMSKQADIFNRVMPRDHIGVVTFFENIVTGSRLILANTHFFWDPAYSDVKLIQAAMLLGEISRLAEKWVNHPAQKDKEKRRIVLADDEGTGEPEVELVPGPSKEYFSKTQIPLVICADQNSEMHSTVSELFTKGTVKPDIPEFKGRAYGNFTKDGIEHPFQLRSAYTNLDKSPEAVPYTNYTPGFRGVIDHIWYSTNALDNTALLGKVDEEYMATVPGFPNYHFPSDHIALMAEFSMKSSKTKKAVTEPDFGSSSRNGDRRRN